jgi:hypothetical protein
MARAHSVASRRPDRPRRPSDAGSGALMPAIVESGAKSEI